MRPVAALPLALLLASPALWAAATGAWPADAALERLLVALVVAGVAVALVGALLRGYTAGLEPAEHDAPRRRRTDVDAPPAAAD